jgi:hypothetical protein
VKRILLVALAVVAGLAPLAMGPAQAAPGKEKVKLVRRTKKGDRLSVKEDQHTETTFHYKGEGEGAVGAAEVEDVAREYLQEVVKEDPLVLKRDYKSSTRLKGNPKDDKLEPVKTSVHGKTVILGPDGPRIEGGELSKEDKDDLDTVTRASYACLPKDEVAVGDQWKLGDDLGRAVFGPMYDSENFKAQGTGRLDALKTVDGRRGAKISLKVALEVKPTEVMPSISLELKGQGFFLIEEGVFSELSLEGPMRIEINKVENGHKRTLSGEAQRSYKLHGEVASSAPDAPPPKPLAKDDELAHAEAVQCSKGHKFPNRFLFCAQCGKEIDQKTFRCAGGCKPLLRFCPICGEGLVPATK